MKAAVITIGDEILIGQITDTNSGYIAKQLNNIGIDVLEMRSVSDDATAILNVLENFQNKVAVVVLTGGLGPTKDDLTKKIFCDYFGDVLVEDKKVLEHVTQLIENYFKRPITALNKAQALVPSQCEVLFNQLGTAPGMWMQKEQTIYVSLPGVPYEMKHLIDELVIPKLQTVLQRPFIVHKTLLTYGIGESLLAEQIEDWENALPTFIKLAYLPSPGKVRLRLTAKGTNENELKDAIDKAVEALKPIIKNALVGFEEEESIEVVLSQKMTALGYTLATAESCTGGKIAATLTAISGASAFFKGSIVSYATQTKTDFLDIPLQDLKNNGIVSTSTASQMALAVQKKFKTDYAIATTGVAGPAKGDDDKEPGTVCIAIATPTSVFSEAFFFGQPREKVIDRAVNKALELLHKEILKNN